MSGLRDAIAVQQRAITDLEESRRSSAAWADAQREKLDRQRLDPITKEAKHLLAELRSSAHEIASLQKRLAR